MVGELRELYISCPLLRSSSSHLAGFFMMVHHSFCRQMSMCLTLILLPIDWWERFGWKMDNLMDWLMDGELIQFNKSRAWYEVPTVVKLPSLHAVAAKVPHHAHRNVNFSMCQSKKPHTELAIWVSGSWEFSRSWPWKRWNDGWCDDDDDDVFWGEMMGATRVHFPAWIEQHWCKGRMRTQKFPYNKGLFLSEFVGLSVCMGGWACYSGNQPQSKLMHLSSNDSLAQQNSLSLPYTDVRLSRPFLWSTREINLNKMGVCVVKVLSWLHGAFFSSNRTTMAPFSHLILSLYLTLSHIFNWKDDFWAEAWKHTWGATHIVEDQHAHERERESSFSMKLASLFLRPDYEHDLN